MANVFMLHSCDDSVSVINCESLRLHAAPVSKIRCIFKPDRVCVCEVINTHSHVCQQKQHKPLTKPHSDWWKLERDEAQSLASVDAWEKMLVIGKTVRRLWNLPLEQCANSIYLWVHLCTFKKCLFVDANSLFFSTLWELFRDNGKSFILYYKHGTDICSDLCYWKQNRNFINKAHHACGVNSVFKNQYAGEIVRI